MLDYITDFKRECDNCINDTKCEECCVNCESNDICDCSCYLVNDNANCETCWFK